MNKIIPMLHFFWEIFWISLIPISFFFYCYLTTNGPTLITQFNDAGNTDKQNETLQMTFNPILGLLFIFTLLTFTTIASAPRNKWFRR
jgi:hypothetical protein